MFLAETAKKASELTNVDNALATVNENYAKQLQALEAQRGKLIASQIAAIKAGDTELALSIATQRAGLEMNLSSLLNSRDQFNQTYQLDQAQIFGQTPGIQGTVTLKDYVDANGGSLAWDANTGNVTLNGRTYTPTQLENAGGYIQNGRWQLPESIVKSMM
jgi:hypothetical protein